MARETHSRQRQLREQIAQLAARLIAEDGIDELARSATVINSQTENIGARRLHTILERVLETVSFNAPDEVQGRVVIDRAYVQDRLSELLKDQDLSRFIL